MDLLFHEYASPFVLLDNIIRSGRFTEFIEKFEHQRNERSRWEFFIHKIPPWNDMTWEEFNQQLDSQEIDQTPVNPEQLETTVTESFELLQGFRIDERG